MNDRRDHRAGLRVGFLPGVNRAGFEFELAGIFHIVDWLLVISFGRRLRTRYSTCSHRLAKPVNCL
jgi:hypothetical protein